MLKTESIRIDNDRVLRVARLGTGTPLVMLHGYPDTLQIWSKVAPLLAPKHEVIAFDWPGLGGSSKWHGGTTPTAMAERLGQVLDVLGITACNLCGFDMGGQPALVFAAQHPKRVQRLIVMNSLVLGDQKTSWEIALLRKFKLNRFFLRHTPRLVFWRALRTFMPRGMPVSEELRDEFWLYFAQREVREVIIRMCAGYQGQLQRLPDIYRQIETPTLLLWGGNDKHFPVQQAQQLALHLKRAALSILESGQHWTPLQIPSVVATEIERFLKNS